MQVDSSLVCSKLFSKECCRAQLRWAFVCRSWLFDWDHCPCTSTPARNWFIDQTVSSSTRVGPLTHFFAFNNGFSLFLFISALLNSFNTLNCPQKRELMEVVACQTAHVNTYCVFVCFVHILFPTSLSVLYQCCSSDDSRPVWGTVAHVEHRASLQLIKVYIMQKYFKSHLYYLGVLVWL